MRIGGQRIPGITLLLLVSESALIGFALALAAAIRLQDLDLLRRAMIDVGLLYRFSIVVLVCVLSLYYYDLYDLQIVSRRSVLFVRLLQALGTACLILALLYYAAPDLSLGRSIAAIAAPLIGTLVLGWRLLVDASAPILRRRERILIVGRSAAGQSLWDEVHARPELNLHIVGFLETEQRRLAEAAAAGDYGGYLWARSATRLAVIAEPARATNRRSNIDARSVGVLVPETILSTEISSLATLGEATDVARVAIQERADRVVLALSERRQTMPVAELLRLKFLGVRIEEVHDVYERITGRILLDHLSPSWLILSNGFSKSKFLMATKRIIDVTVATVALLISTPVIILVALAILLESGTPVLFRQMRVGQHGRLFKILKFRSMRTDSRKRENEAPQWTATNDRRITRVGQFIRKFRLDELPQLLNVLKGDMSLVGPRPEQPQFVEMLEERIPYYGQRHTSRPGITGWAQVKYGYGASVEESRAKLEYDLFYIKHLSFALDLAIIFETGKVLLSGRGAK